MAQIPSAPLGTGSIGSLPITKQGINMETYRLPISASPSNFVSKIQWWAKISASAAAQLGTDQTPATTFIQYDFPTDAACEWWAIWFGTNGTTAASNHVVFTAINLASVQAGAALPAQWIAHV